MEGGRGVVGGGHCQLWTKRGNLLDDAGVVEMVFLRGIYAPKLCASCPSSGTGLRGGTKINGGNTAKRPQYTVAETARRKRVKSCDGADGQRSG